MSGRKHISRETYHVILPPSVGSAAQKFAEADGVSLDQWVSLAVAQKIGSAETVAEFFRRCAEGQTRKDFWNSPLRAGPRARTGRRAFVIATLPMASAHGNDCDITRSEA
jgi:hypothetical protein